MARAKTRNTEKALETWLSTIKAVDDDAVLDIIRNVAKKVHAEGGDKKDLCTVSTIVATLGVSYAPAKKIVRSLEDSGRIRRVRVGQRILLIPVEA